MKKKYLLISIISIISFVGCDEQITEEVASQEKVVSLLSKIDENKITAYSFTDRNYAYNFYNNSKYAVTGNPKTGLINYYAKHQFKLFNNNVVNDDIEVTSLDGVENTKDCSTALAKGQIYLKDDYVYDYFIKDEDSFVNCYEIDAFTSFDTYFNYLSIIGMAQSAFSDPSTYFPETSGYSTPKIEITTSEGIETYKIGSSYAGDSSYKPYIIDFEIVYNSNTHTFNKIMYKERSMFASLDDDYEIGTSSLAIYTITNLEFNDRTEYNGNYYSLDDIKEDSIHNAPKKIVDVSSFEDGNLPDETVLNIFRNIYAYSNHVRQINYSMLYHNAFDFANTDRPDFGDAYFVGKLVSYKNNIVDNNGYIQLADKNDQPVGDKYNYRIFSKVIDDLIVKGGIFSKYITSSFACVSKNSVTSSRDYLDANPLYWPEIKEIYNAFSLYNLGNNRLDGGETYQINVSGTKKGTSLEIKGQIHYRASTFTVENVDTFTFNIENDKLMYCKFNSTGETRSDGKYTDIYEAKFVHADKEDFIGEEMNFDDINTQVTMEDFAII